MRTEYASSGSDIEGESSSELRLTKEELEQDLFYDAFVEYEDTQTAVDGVPISWARRSKRKVLLNALGLSVIVSNCGEFMRKSQGKFKQDDNLRYLHDHYMDTVTAGRHRYRHIGGTMNMLVQKRRLNIEEAGWILHGAGRDIKTSDLNLKWVMIEGLDPIPLADYTLNYATISTWLDPATFFDLQMPPDIMRVLEFKIGTMNLNLLSYKRLSSSKDPAMPASHHHHHHQQPPVDMLALASAADQKNKNTKKEEEDKKAIDKVGDVLDAHARIIDEPSLRYDLVTLACDAFECLRYKFRLLAQFPVRRVPHRGRPDDAHQLDRYLSERLKTARDKHFESEGRNSILQSSLPIGASDRFKRQNPYMMGFHTVEEVFRSSIVDDETFDRISAQRDYPIYTSPAEAEGKLQTRDRYIREQKAIYQKNLERGIREMPDAFIASDGQTVTQRMIDGFTLEMAPETRDM